MQARWHDGRMYYGRVLKLLNRESHIHTNTHTHTGTMLITVYVRTFPLIQWCTTLLSMLGLQLILCTSILLCLAYNDPLIFPNTFMFAEMAVVLFDDGVEYTAPINAVRKRVSLFRLSLAVMVK